MIFDPKPIIQKEYNKMVIQIFKYICHLNKVHELNPEWLKYSLESVPNCSIQVKTYRYNGELWLRAFPNGITPEQGYRFESPFFKN